jgi:hypothetical protein
MPLNEQLLLLGSIALIALLLIIGGLFILRAALHRSHRRVNVFDRVVLQILVPKERKTEGPSGAASDDRIEQIREEIAITETFFSTIAGLKAERGLKQWIRGRSDTVAFEIVAVNGLIYFYMDVHRRMQRMVEEQIHAQYPHAHIEEMTDYNMFHEKSAIAGAYLSTTGSHVLPIKTYKTMDSDPLSGILNVLSKVQESNGAAAVQYIVRSAHKRWRQPGARIVSEVRKGKTFDEASKASNSANLVGELFRAVAPAKKKNDPLQAPRGPSQVEEDMLKSLEQKMSKGGLDVTIRLIATSDIPDTARSQLDNLVNAFSQYNLYRQGNSFTAAVPRNQKRIIQDFIFRSFNEKRETVLNTEEMASLWHLPLPSTEAPYIKWLTARRAPPPANAPGEGILLGHVLYRGVDAPIRMKEGDRRRHHEQINSGAFRTRAIKPPGGVENNSRPSPKNEV